MKKQVTIIAATILATFMLTFAAQAQTSGPVHLKATIPFEFQVGNQVLAAGEYTVTCLNPTSPNRILNLSTKDGSKVVIQTSDTKGKPGDNARLVFHRFGDKYFLSQAWLAADESGLAIQKSRSEKEMERQLAGVKPRNTTVAMSRR
jgi:hypothetical protein